jgi:hypothetical protein
MGELITAGLELRDEQRIVVAEPAWDGESSRSE